ncbi:SAM-dependent methyltransferase [Candidatus Methylobacter favarea]|uniref:SAM-dependent methyltransferase n=1 Tax=Candidatus Methylobacter favarea TaxID=2707345 RepID=A0A8S0WIZ7_9GAMM|nr:fused MFS/spermidine synthase [Candidatus Methylobacter favarea]CAA9890924.1 SAM-dependent methyltransferase [Candidatus Methylobacter favarea]
MTNPLNVFERAGLYLTVFLTGASVMLIELLGTRMIAPFYGTSLYVWSSLISVTMIALAIGYFVGGRWADRAQRTGLSLIIALAALLTLLIPGLTRTVLLATDPLGLRLGAFASAFVLFMPSLTMLGMVGPFAIKLSTSRLDGIGAGAGSIYAVSTVGSVVGTLLLGFFLFPAAGSREILISLAGLLFLLALVIAVYEKRRLGMPAALLPNILLIIIGAGLLPKIVSAGHAYTGGKTFQIQSEQESLYGWVRVIDQPSRDLRFLASDASMIGAASISTGKSRLSYQEIVNLLPALTPKMTRALIIGLGAGHMAKVLRDRYGLEVDTLEIDPAVAKAASDYFGFRSAGKDIIGDARYEIRRLKGNYDLIIHDCFTGGTEPTHLLTVEALAQLQKLLSAQGLLALNFVAFSQGGKNAALASVSRTLEQVFKYHSLFISEPGEDFNDFVFLAGSRPIDLKAKPLQADQAAWLQNRVLTLDNAHGVILTDNFNPLEYLQVRKSEHYRHVLVDWFGHDILVR